MFEIDINWTGVALAAAAYSGSPVVFSVLAGAVAAYMKPGVSSLNSTLVGAGIGLLGAIVLVCWGLATLGMAFDSSMGDSAPLAIFLAGPFVVSAGCAWITWAISSLSSTSEMTDIEEGDALKCQ